MNTSIAFYNYLNNFLQYSHKGGVSAIRYGMDLQWQFGDIMFVKEVNEINFEHDTIYPLCVVVEPNSSIPSIYDGFEEYEYEIYFAMLWNKDNRDGSKDLFNRSKKLTAPNSIVNNIGYAKGLNLDNKYDNIELMANEFIDRFLGMYDNSDLLIVDNNISYERIKSFGNDKTIAMKLSFTLQAFRQCFQSKRFTPLDYFDRNGNTTSHGLYPIQCQSWVRSDGWKFQEMDRTKVFAPVLHDMTVQTISFSGTGRMIGDRRMSRKLLSPQKYSSDASMEVIGKRPQDFVTYGSIDESNKFDGQILANSQQANNIHYLETRPSLTDNTTQRNTYGCAYWNHGGYVPTDHFADYPQSHQALVSSIPVCGTTLFCNSTTILNNNEWYLQFTAEFDQSLYGAKEKQTLWDSELRSYDFTTSNNVFQMGLLIQFGLFGTDRAIYVKFVNYQTNECTTVTVKVDDFNSNLYHTQTTSKVLTFGLNLRKDPSSDQAQLIFIGNDSDMINIQAISTDVFDFTRDLYWGTNMVTILNRRKCDDMEVDCVCEDTEPNPEWSWSEPFKQKFYEMIAFNGDLYKETDYINESLLLKQQWTVAEIFRFQSAQKYGEMIQFYK